MTEPIAILLVEDNPADVESTLRAFKRRRLVNAVAIARDGEEALDYVHRRGRFAAHAPVPGLILLDVRLPKVDGLDIKTSYELGAASYIVKPVEFANFLEVVERLEFYWTLTNVPYSGARVRG